MIKAEFTPCPLCGQNEYKVVSKGNDFELNSSDDEYQFVECNKCGLLRLNPRPVQEELKRIYPQNYSCYQIESFYSPLLNKIRIALQKRFIRIIKKYAIENATILDVDVEARITLNLQNTEKRIGILLEMILTLN
jgi:hypothetical protein